MIMLIMRVTGKFFANCKVQYKHAILPSLRFSKGESDHRLGLIIFHPDPLFPWVCVWSPGRPGCPESWMDGNEVPELFPEPPIPVVYLGNL